MLHTRSTGDELRCSTGGRPASGARKSYFATVCAKTSKSDEFGRPKCFKSLPRAGKGWGPPPGMGPPPGWDKGKGFMDKGKGFGPPPGMGPPPGFDKGPPRGGQRLATRWKKDALCNALAMLCVSAGLDLHGKGPPPGLDGGGPPYILRTLFRVSNATRRFPT